MKKLFLAVCMISLVVAICVADNASWTFDADEEGWNSPSGTWNTTIAHSAVEGLDAAGSIQCTDSDIWYGARNTVTIGASDPSYTIVAWAKLISTAPGVDGGLNLDTWNLDKDNSGGTSVPFDASTTDSWQTQTQSGIAGTSLGTGYIMINAGPWSGADAATVEFFLDDITYTEGSRVQDWSLFIE